MRRILACLILIIFFTPALSAAAEPATPSAPPSQTSQSIPPGQALRFEHLGLEDGLSQSAILAMLQDQQGYLWFGTQDGLNRYDGYSFTIFRNDPQDANSLSHNSVIALAQSPENGSIWIGTWGGGLNRYDPRSGRFTAFKHDPADPASLSDDTVTSLLFRSDGSLWVGTTAGLDRYTGSGFEHYRHDPQNPGTLSANNIATLYEDSQENLWVGTGGLGMPGNGLNRLNPDDTFTRYEFDADNPYSLSSGNITSILQDSQGTIWVGTGGFNLDGAGLNRLNADGSFTRFRSQPNQPASLSVDNILSLWQAPDGMVWIGTWSGGLNLFDPRQPEAGFRHFQHDPLDTHSLSNDTVWSILADRTGIIWLGTVPGGINKFNPRTAQFALYRHQPGNPNSLSYNTIGGFYEDSAGRMWVATWGGGLNLWERTTNQFSVYRNDPANPASLPSDVVNAILEDHTGQFWVAHMAGASWFNPQTGQFSPVLLDPADPQSTVTSLTYALAENSQGVWVCTFSGLYRFDLQTKRSVVFHTDPANPASLSSDACTSLLVDQNDNLWVGTWGGGLNHYNPASDQFTRYQNDPADPNSLSDASVWVLFQDQQGTLWIGTQAGLNRLNADGSFTRYRLANGLPNETIMGIQGDAEGKLWVSTGNGLVRFDPKTASFKVYDSTAGLQSNEFNGGAAYTDRQGNLYFGGVDGFNVFDPLQIRDNSTPPPVAVTTVSVFNEPIEADLSGDERLEIPYWQNFIAFEFVGLDFAAPEKNRYSYRLEGFDDEWVDAGSRRYAGYTNLPGGDYTFRVKAANSDGTWNVIGASIPLRILPPFWQTSWFIGGLVLAGLAVVAGVYIYRIQAIQAQKRDLEYQVAQRTNELRRAQAELARHAAEELSVSQARFQAMFDNAAVGIGIMGLDRTIIDANPAMCRMLGYTRQELVGQTPAFTTYPEDYPLSTQNFDILVSGEKDHYWMERRYVRKTGEVFWAQVTMSVVRGPEGEPRFLVGMVIDIDEQKRAILALQESEERFRTLYDNAEMGIVLVDLGEDDDNVVDEARFDKAVASQRINPAMLRMFGYAAEELQAINITNLIYAEDHGLDKNQFMQLLKGESDGYRIEKRFVRKDGQVFWGRLTDSLVRSANGRPRMIIGIIEDINEERQAKEQLAAQEAEYRRTLEQRVDERTYALAEANIRLLEEIEQRQRAEKALAAKAADDAVIAERTRLARDLHDAVTQTLFAASLVAEVLPDLWQMDPNEAQKSTDELRQLTRGALAEMRTLLVELRPAALTQARLGDLLRQLTEALIGRARLPVTLTVEGERSLPPEVQVALYRIAQESLNNVFKYARASQVNVQLVLSPAGAHLEISDNGVGFEPSNVRPTSLGQRIMRERAESVGADLQVTSAPGQGTTVSVTWVEERSGVE